jgi:predicted RNA-binding protein with PIN domain
MYTSSPRALLLVDGYNIIGSWSSLQKTRDQYGLEMARYELVEKLLNYTAHQGYQTQVVFDSYYQNTPGSQEEYSPNVSIYFTAFAQTADTYIEKTCASYYSRRAIPIASRLIVATSDQAQRRTIQGYGAEWLSAKELETDLETTHLQIKRKQRPKKPAQGRFLVNSLDIKVQQRLAQLRHGINPDSKNF